MDLYDLYRSAKFSRNQQSLDYISKSVKSGDLILFKYKDSNFVQKLFINFTHVGLVIVDPITKHPYIIEHHDKDDLKHVNIYSENVNLYPLVERIKTYEGTACISYINKEVPYNLIDDILTDYNILKIEFDSNYKMNYIKRCVLTMNNKNLDGKLSCAQFILILLNMLNITDNKNIDCFVPDDILTLKTINNYRYSYPITIRK